jgi:hypothetical protein
MSISIPFDVPTACACHQPFNTIGGTVTTAAPKPSKGGRFRETRWTTNPADSILRPFRFGTGCFVGVAGFRWGPCLRGGVRPILAADLTAHAPYNYEGDQAIATRKGEPRQDRSQLFRRGKVCNEPRTRA